MLETRAGASLFTLLQFCRARGWRAPWFEIWSCGPAPASLQVAQRASLYVHCDNAMTVDFRKVLNLFNQLCINGLGLTNTISFRHLYVKHINSPTVLFIST